MSISVIHLYYTESTSKLKGEVSFGNFDLWFFVSVKNMKKHAQKAFNHLFWASGTRDIAIFLNDTAVKIGVFSDVIYARAYFKSNRSDVNKLYAYKLGSWQQKIMLSCLAFGCSKMHLIVFLIEICESFYLWIKK